MLAFALLGTYLLLRSFAANAPLINEDFSSSAANFQVIKGGTWTVSNGVYILTNPAAATDPRLGLYNLSLHNTPVSGDFNLTLNASNTPGTSPWDDFAVVFGYQDANNYYYAVFNEQTDDYTNGIFKIVNGVQTKLTSFASNITPGTTYAIAISKTGNTYKVLRDGVQVGLVSDATFGGGRIGLGSRDDGATFDNVRVDVPDTTPPTAPTGLQATAKTTSSISLGWAASTDNSGVAGYRVYRNGSASPVATTSIAAYTDSGLAASTAYSYTVLAYDASGNVSTASAALQVATNAVTTTTTTTTTTTSTGKLLFNGNFETGSLSQWVANQSCPWGVTVVSSPVRAGRYAAKFTLDDGDVTSRCPKVPNTGNPRAQLVGGPDFLRNGDEGYASVSVFLPAGFPASVPSNAFQIAQIYGSPYGGGPIIGLYLSGSKSALQLPYKDSKGTLIYYRPWFSSTNNTIGTAWQDYTIHFKLSPDPKVGFIELWYNKQKQYITHVDGTKTQKYYMATLVKGVNWDGTNTEKQVFDVNQYRKANNNLGTVTMYHDEAKIGTTYDSVQP